MDEGKTNSYEAMKQELIEAGYQFLAEHFAGMSFDDYTGWVQAPDGTWIEGESFSYKMRSDWEEAQRKADDSCIEKTYQHLQEKKRLAAMEDVLSSIYTIADVGEKLGDTEYFAQIKTAISKILPE